MKKKVQTLYYVLLVFGGVEIEVRGPWNNARKFHKEQDETDSTFWADMKPNRTLAVGSYMHGFFGNE